MTAMNFQASEATIQTSRAYQAPPSVSLFGEAIPRSCRDWSIFYRLNENLDHLGIPYDINRKTLEDFLAVLEYFGDSRYMEYWLITARITEAALLLAGHYADNCEFTAAGDLLVKPGSMPGPRRPRNVFEGEQILYAAALTPSAFLPGLHDRLIRSQCFQQHYLDSIWQRMQQVADTLGFLAAWQVSNAEDLYWRMARATPRRQAFIKSRLCRFKQCAVEGRHILKRL